MENLTLSIVNKHYTTHLSYGTIGDGFRIIIFTISYFLKHIYFIKQNSWLYYLTFYKKKS